MRYRIEPAPTFTKEAAADGDKPARSAFVMASVWLSQRAEQGWEPVAVEAVGTDGCVHLYGAARSKSALVFRRTQSERSATTTAAKKRSSK